MLRSFTAFLLVASVWFGAFPAHGEDVPGAIRALLLGGSSGSHKPTDFANAMIPPLKESGIQVTYTDDVGQFNRSRLNEFDMVMIFKDDGELSTGQEAALIEMVEEGKGLLAVHCASHCFRNSAGYTKLIGGRFDHHGHGDFRPAILNAQHPITRGLNSFATRDETYVHNQLGDDLEVLMARPHEGGYEPYTWVRRQGKGRVFYTALGHDETTWRNAGFQKLMVYACRWLAGKLPEVEPPLVVKDDKPTPLSPADSVQRMHLPEGFHVELFAAEPDIVKPIAMTFDARGRLWIAESVDYPNDVLPPGRGHDRIKICEDTDGNGRADNFTVFAEGLNIPTSLHPYRDGVIVACAPDILFLRDKDGDGRMDDRQVVFTGFGRFDTHAVHSNFRYGLDNWIWATIGYSGAAVKVGDKVLQFKAGVFRFRPDGSQMEVLTPTQSNTWGLGFNSVGDPFISKANDDHSLHLAIPNRYFESVRGWFGVGNTAIADHKKFHPVSEDIRQVDWHGGYTAASGQTIYTAAAFPEQYRDRAAFVCEPTGHLIHIDFLVPQGTSFVARDGYNLLASTDPWTAPIETQVGPDGAVWFIDWYNYIVRHNPTPPGFQTGAGNAYVTPDRDRAHGRIYRIVHESAPAIPKPRLDQASNEELFKALHHDNQWWRLTAQRLLVERSKDFDLTPLVNQAADPNPIAAMHALATLAGRGAFEQGSPWLEGLNRSLAHPSAQVRRIAVSLLPKTAESTQQILVTKNLTQNDEPLQLATLLALADMPGSAEVALAIKELLSDPAFQKDRWLPTAAIAALAPSTAEFLANTLSNTEEPASLDISPALRDALRILAEHYARGETHDSLRQITHGLGHASPSITAPVVEGFLAGWPSQKPLTDIDSVDANLAACLKHMPLEKTPGSSLARAVGRHGRGSRLGLQDDRRTPQTSPRG
ncbi:MAG: PVC-type heme-binding CxxCH protein [Planctomycetota bacterium]